MNWSDFLLGAAAAVPVVAGGIATVMAIRKRMAAGKAPSQVQVWRDIEAKAKAARDARPRP